MIKKSQLVAIICLPMLAAELVLPALSRAITSQQIYELCRAFPLNINCKGYRAPVTVERPKQDPVKPEAKPTQP
jgi:hypothetical protein